MGLDAQNFTRENLNYLEIIAHCREPTIRDSLISISKSFDSHTDIQKIKKWTRGK